MLFTIVKIWFLWCVFGKKNILSKHPYHDKELARYILLTVQKFKILFPAHVEKIVY